MDDKNLFKSSANPQLFDLNNPLVVSNPEFLETRRTRFILPASSDNRHGERVLEIPYKSLDSDLLNLIMEYLYSSYVSRFSEATKFTAVAQLAKFFEFVESLDGVYLNDTALVYPKYKMYLETITKEKTAYKFFMAVGKVLRWAKNQDAIGDTPKYWTEVTKDTLNRIPEIPKPRDEPRQTISEALQFDEVDDDILLLSVRAYAAYFLDKTFQLREYIKAQEPEIFLGVLDIVREKGLTDFGLNSSLRSHSLKNIKCKNLNDNLYKNKLFELKKLLIPVLNKAPENLVGFFPSLIGTDGHTKDSLQKRIIDNFWLPTRADWESTLKVCNPNFHFVNLLFPTNSEQIAMCYLLSSDRIQPSGIDKLKIDNFRKTNKSVQICDFNKARSGKGFDTPVYKSDSPIYKAYSRWFDMFTWLSDADLLHREGNWMQLTTS